MIEKYKNLLYLNEYTIGICGDEDGKKYFPVAEIKDGKKFKGEMGSGETISAHFLRR